MNAHLTKMHPTQGIAVLLHDYLCNKCKRPGHFARDCPDTTVCNNCGFLATCWNCKESGHLANQCSNDPICHMCGKMGHLANQSHGLPAHDTRLCNNSYKADHIAADCTNEKACNDCRKTGHLAHDCTNKSVYNMCNISGHVVRQCAKSDVGSDGGGGHFRDIICQNCAQLGHIRCDCASVVICKNCGGMSHLAFEHPSGRMYNSGLRRY